MYSSGHRDFDSPNAAIQMADLSWESVYLRGDVEAMHHSPDRIPGAWGMTISHPRDWEALQ